MSEFKLKLEIEPKEKYEKAKKDVLGAMKSVGELSEKQRYELCKEIIGMECSSQFYNMMKQYVDGKLFDKRP